MIEADGDDCGDPVEDVLDDAADRREERRERLDERLGPAGRVGRGRVPRRRSTNRSSGISAKNAL